MFRRKCKITFIKHGSTIYSDENRLSDNPNYPPLNEVGKIESAKIAQWVQKRSPKVNKIYTSPDLKTVQTCKIIAQEYGVKFDVIEGLYSRKMGDWDGLTFKQLENLETEPLKEYHQNRANFWGEGGETTTQLATRSRNIISDLITQNIGKRIIIVTHGDIIQTEIAHALGISLEKIGQIYIPCGSATQLSYFEDWTSLVYSGMLPL